MRHLRPPSTLAAEHGVSLIELLVASLTAIVVMLALSAILLFSTGQEARVSERVEADRIGRTAMARVVDELHSACTGFGNGGIQGPSGEPKPPLAPTGPLNLWFVSAYGSSTSWNALESTVYEHDINWTETGKSKTSPILPLGTLTDYAFESTNGSGPSSKTGKWEFPELKVANAKAHVLAANVIPYTVSKANPIFQYSTVSTTTGEFTPLTEKTSTEASTEAAAGKIAKVAISFEQAPPSGDTMLDRVVPFDDAVVLRFSATETGEVAKDEPCT